MSLVQTHESDLSYKLIMMDYFLVLLTFKSKNDIVVNKDAENMFIGNTIGIISSKISQKCLKFSYRLTLVRVHVSCLKETKHQTCKFLCKSFM